MTGAHSFRGGLNWTTGDWQLADDVDRRRAADHLQRRPAGVGDAAPAVGSQATASIATSASIHPGQVVDEPGHAEPRPPLRPVHRRIARELGVAEPLRARAPTFGECPDGTVDPADLCTGMVQNWKDISPRVGFAMDVFGNGRTAIKASYARYVAGQAIAFANQVNPIGALDRDGHAHVDRPRRQRPAASTTGGNIQFNELTNSASTPTFGKLTVPTTQYSPDLLRGWGKRGYNNEYTFAMQHQLADRMSVNGGYYRRTFGNQTFTDDLRYDASSYDSFCITAPSRSGPAAVAAATRCAAYGPQAGGVRAEPAGQQPDPLLEGLRRRDEPVSGFRHQPRCRVSATARSSRAASPPRRARSTTATCCSGRLDAVRNAAAAQGTEIYPDGIDELPPRIRLPAGREGVGFATSLPWDVQLGGTYPVHPWRPDRRRRSEHLNASWIGDQRAGCDARRAHWTERRGVENGAA